MRRGHIWVVHLRNVRARARARVRVCVRALVRARRVVVHMCVSVCACVRWGGVCEGAGGRDARRCVCACSHACARACARSCASVCVHVGRGKWEGTMSGRHAGIEMRGRVFFPWAGARRKIGRAVGLYRGGCAPRFVRDSGLVRAGGWCVGEKGWGARASRSKYSDSDVPSRYYTNPMVQRV